MKQDVLNNFNQSNIQINGQPIADENSPLKETVAAKGSFGSFLEQLNKSLKKDHQVITAIKVNGNAITEEEEKNLYEHSLSDLSDIEIFTSSPVEIAHETLNTLDQYIDRIITNIDRAGMHYSQNNILSGDDYFVKSIDGLDLFIQTISGVKQALRVGLVTKVGLAEASLMSIMNELLMAKKQNNYIFMADLLRKDLIENLKEWKNDVFPIFKNWRMS